MANLNRVLLMGNLTRDPELRYLPSQMPVVSLGLAINRRWKNKQGEQQEEAVFVDCEAFGRTAEVINQYLKKGRPIFIEGQLRLDQWTDKDGNKRSKLKVFVENFQFVDGRGEGAGAPGGAPVSDHGGAPPPRPVRAPSAPAVPASGAAPANGARPPAPGADAGPHQPIEEEDIPF
jgi:single-strand DNA-binding protein